MRHAVTYVGGEPVALWRGTGILPVKTGQHGSFPWRLAHGQDAHATLWEFYDLHTDPNELKNVYSAGTHAERIATMKKDLQRLRKHYKVPKGVPG